jgi:hypothetical protein
VLTANIFKRALRLLAETRATARRLVQIETMNKLTNFITAVSEAVLTARLNMFANR